MKPLRERRNPQIKLRGVILCMYNGNNSGSADTLTFPSSSVDISFDRRLVVEVVDGARHARDCDTTAAADYWRIRESESSKPKKESVAHFCIPF